MWNRSEEEPHKVDIFSTLCGFSFFKGGDMMGQKDDVLTDDFRKVRNQETLL